MTEEQVLDSMKRLAKSDSVYEYAEFVKSQVADVRNSLAVNSEHDREVRLAVCDVIDAYFISKLRQISRNGEPPQTEFH